MPGPPLEAHDSEFNGGSAVNLRAMAPHAKLIDVRQRGRERVIGAWDLGGAIVDPGPESRIETLLEGCPSEPRALLLTHIHLDHAGATGALVERFPDLEVWVHARGAPHLVDPTKLLRERRADLRRRHGARCGAGSCRCPERNLRVLEGGETIAVGGPRVRRRVHARATPPTTSSTSTAPTAPPTSATSPACGSRRPTSCGRRRRRPTSTSRRGSARSTSSRERQPRRLALTHFGVGRRPAAASGADEGRPATSRPSSPARCSRSTATRDAGGRGVRRRGRPRSRARRVGRRDRRGASRWARRSSSSGSGCALLAEAGRAARRAVMATETIERPRIGGPGRGAGGAWRVIVLNDNHNTFDHVARTLARVIPSVTRRPGLPDRRPDPQHRPAIVWTGEREPAELYWEQLKRRGAHDGAARAAARAGRRAYGRWSITVFQCRQHAAARRARRSATA